MAESIVNFFKTIFAILICIIIIEINAFAYNWTEIEKGDYLDTSSIKNISTVWVKSEYSAESCLNMPTDQLKRYCQEHDMLFNFIIDCNAKTIGAIKWGDLEKSSGIVTTLDNIKEPYIYDIEPNTFQEKIYHRACVIK